MLKGKNDLFAVVVAQLVQWSASSIWCHAGNLPYIEPKQTKAQALSQFSCFEDTIASNLLSEIPHRACITVSMTSCFTSKDPSKQVSSTVILCL